MATGNWNHHDHWKKTVEDLDLRAILIAGMAVFIAYFQVRQTTRPLPSFFVINPYLSAGAFLVVVSRLHLIMCLEPDMSAWWDRTIDAAPHPCKIFDYAFEGPWLFLVIALPFSCISVVTYGIAYAVWCGLELCYMAIGRYALGRAKSQDSLPASLAKDDDLYNLVDQYYRVRLQHEACGLVLATLTAVVVGLRFSGSLAIGGVLLASMLVLITLVEVRRNPWFRCNLRFERESPGARPTRHEGLAMLTRTASWAI